MKNKIDVHPDDTIWLDTKVNSHVIAEMDISYVEACIRVLHKHGFKKEEMPKALFKRYAQRHAVVREEFDEL